MARFRVIAGRLAAGALVLTAVSAVHEPVVWDSDLSPPPALAVAPRTQRHILDERLQAMGKAFGGSLGVAVYNVDEGWAVDFNGAQIQPQQSVSKLWVALAVLDAVDRVTNQRIARQISPRRAGDPDSLISDNRRIKATLPWVPQYEDLDTIVAHALQWERKLSEIRLA